MFLVNKPITAYKIADVDIWYNISNFDDLIRDQTVIDNCRSFSIIIWIHLHRTKLLRRYITKDGFNYYDLEMRPQTAE